MTGFIHLNEILNIILFLSTGCLTLIALVSFFTSITLQPKIAVAREILNDIEKLKYEDISDNYNEKLINLFTRYKRISNEDFASEKKIILNVKIGLIIILLIWSSILIITIPSFFTIEWIYLLMAVSGINTVVFLFYKLFESSKDIFGMSTLPKYEHLLDLNNKMEIDLIEIMGKSMRIIIEDSCSEASIVMGFPMIFKGAYLKPIVWSFKSELNNDFFTHFELDFEESIDMDSLECFRHLSDKNVWYKLIEKVNLSNGGDTIHFQVMCTTEFSAINVVFILRKEELSENDNRIFLIPNHISVIVSKHSDILNAD